jgi:hypothetical protein
MSCRFLTERIHPVTQTPRTSSRRLATRLIQMYAGGCALVLPLVAGGLLDGEAHAGDALVLGRDVLIRQTPQTSAKVIKTTRPGETYEVISRKTGKGTPLYVFDERGDLWVKVRVTGELHGFVRTDLVSVTREEYRSPRGDPLLIVNLRLTADGTFARELWLVLEGWKQTRRLAPIEGGPIWASHGEWFIVQVESERPIKDPNVERTIERIEKFSADGRHHLPLAAGSNPVLHEARGEVYFYRDVDEQGEAVPPGLFAVSLDGTNLRPVFLLPERHRFWKEDGDFFVQVPPPVLQAAANRISLRAFDRTGTRIRITVTLDGQLVEQRPE